MSKADKFKGLLGGGGSSDEAPAIKQTVIEGLVGEPANEPIPSQIYGGKKKATFELDPELHKWLKRHALDVDKNMVDIVEEALRQYRRKVGE